MFQSDKVYSVFDGISHNSKTGYYSVFTQNRAFSLYCSDCLGRPVRFGKYSKFFGFKPDRYSTVSYCKRYFTVLIRRFCLSV